MEDSDTDNNPPKTEEKRATEERVAAPDAKAQPSTDSTDKAIPTKRRAPETRIESKFTSQKKDRKSRKVSTTGKSHRGPTRTFPHFSLEDCYKLAHAIREFNAGNPWSPKEIAAALNMGMGSNYFYLTASARDYGITLGTRASSKIELTELGRALAYPNSPAQFNEALVTSFRNIPLFAKVYDYYQGKNLPDIQYLKNTLKTTFGVDDKFQDSFYELFQKNLSFIREKTGSSPSSSIFSDKTSATQSSDSSIILGESQGTLVAFVAMPFSEKTSTYRQGYFDEVLKHLITPAAVKANFNARTAKKAGSEVIQSTIVNDLDSADLVIVDLTEHNPNVLFELGMRIAFDKPVCLIRAQGTAPIFDIDHMLRVYDYNPALWPSTLETDIPGLSNHISETWKKRDADRSYLKILRDNKTV